ncbi:SDR family oxidoreductase [Paraburkholderia sp.]|uniref:SDR family oxidoreductase n=1 Tax=Paraburkholderia sp. TaxID=1926495 RepID=UPI003D6FDEF2
MKNWTIDDIPDQQGRLVVVTGATGGIGYEAALALAGAGAEVVLTGRDAAKGGVALNRIRVLHPGANVRYEHLDLANLASVRAFADSFSSRHPALDLLVNNAGVMTPPTRHTTDDGFELQFGTNYLSHFALTARLLPLLRAGRDTRVVNVSSSADRLLADIHFDDLQWERRYRPWRAYAQSKLAMSLFAFELQRRSDAQGWGLTCVTCHPGYAVTGLQTSGPGLGRVSGRSLFERLPKAIEPFLSQSAADGALPTLFAATSPDAKPGGYYGPVGRFELKGPVGAATIGKKVRDEAVAARLWAASVPLAGVRWPGETT